MLMKLMKLVRAGSQAREKRLNKSRNFGDPKLPNNKKKLPNLHGLEIFRSRLVRLILHQNFPINLLDADAMSC